ncbi:PD-(D/E)XK nuclease family protein [Alicyclobacillus cycloheptanicus]|uniref:ATP-dependent helicase/nuclease subunit B n=1 Tax=Alicyclobacillus cycloheptanicus TaxID=1457 RepID=A0ABT9XEG4_9BACL|nr:PD-(D/E)XK nuclease family protein [Alicyclobacillus cycloheptanicus]MDQ0188691.1 ATP-dependent helicase/nuclease subunit B [Alicyclobacillus cycloheptanicus]WDM00637.1 PD-(D/E)XK nuclease family protein [Alicyclobacillus cycloheptanicus]
MGQVEFRFGRAGTGKSSRIAAEIARAAAADPFGPPIYWIVPGDASYAVERMLLQSVPASVRAEVVSFQRLAERIRADGPQRHLQPLNQTGKRLLLASIYQRRMGDLTVLRRVTPSVAFLDAIMDVFAEFSRHLIHLSQIEGMLQTAAAAVAEAPHSPASFAGRSLIGKLRDLCLLYVDWEEALRTRQLYDPGQVLADVQSELDVWQGFAGATLYVDGFVDLMPVEVAFLTRAAARAERTVVAWSADAGWLADPDSLDGVYAPQTLRACTALRQACAAAGLPVHVETEPLTPGDGRFAAAGDLAVLESALFRDINPAGGLTSEAIHLAAAQNPRAEANGVAEAICRLVRCDGFAFGDIAVLVPRLDDIASLLRDSLERRGVPCDIDAFPAFATHPLAKFVLTALDAAESGLALADCLRLLKSDFCGLTRDEADWLEAYVRKHELSGIEVFAADTAWSFSEAAVTEHDRLADLQAEDARADVLRRRLAAVIVPLLRDVAAPVCDPRTLAEALWRLLERVFAKRVAAEWMVNEDAQESPAEASLHEQAWQRLLGILNDLAEMSEEPLPRSFLFRLVRDDILGQSLSTIPAGVDRVLVTETSRAAAWERRAVFVMGVTDGQFPRRVHAQGLLQDDERVEFEVLFGTRLGDTVELRQLAERAAVYGALTRARERLFLSYPLAGMDGKAVQPSMLLSIIRALFGEAGVSESLWLDDTVRASRGGAGVDVATLTPDVALTWLVTALRSRVSEPQRQSRGAHLEVLQEPVYDAMLDWFSQTKERRAALERALLGLRHDTRAAPLPPALAKWLYRPPITMNVHQLEAFAACPYKHFAAYGLRLEEPQSAGITPAMRGNLIHDTLQAFVEHHLTDIAAWRSLSDDEAVDSMRAQFEAVLASAPFAAWRRTPLRRTQAEEAKQVLDIAAIVLTRHARYGLFEPVAMELSFGNRPDDELPALDVEVAPGVTVSLRGRIDRVDKLETDGRLAFRVVDYKSANLDIDLSRVEHGLQLQLPLYAAVIERHADTLLGAAAEPAGMLYLPIRGHVETRTVPMDHHDAREAAVKAMAAKGLFVDDKALVEAMDRRLSSGATELFRQVYKQDGTPAKAAPVLHRQAWQQMLARVSAHIQDFASRLLDGEIAIAPYRYKSQTPCDFCAFSTVCQIDPRWDKRPFRVLQRFEKDELTRTWAAREQQARQVTLQQREEA